MASHPLVLVAFASDHGQAAKVADRVAAVFSSEGVWAHLEELVGDGPDPLPSDYDAVVVVASLHLRHHQPAVVDWLRRHHSSLGLRPTALLSLSLTAAEDTDEARAATRECIDVLTEETDWTPDRAEPVAGALRYREYDFGIRVVMRLIASQKGVSTDTGHDVEFTDWDEVDRFAREFAADVRRAADRERSAVG
jgi:menaquinone-dependent protoporphyrinogen oxidase